jgi:hypothetical protein
MGGLFPAAGSGRPYPDRSIFSDTELNLDIAILMLDTILHSYHFLPTGQLFELPFFLQRLFRTISMCGMPSSMYGSDTGSNLNER